MQYFSIPALLLLAPVVFVHAAQSPTDFKSLLSLFTGIITILISFIFALTFITIAWGVVQAWIMGDATEEDVAKGKRLVFIGIIALVVMVSVWGIVRLLQQGIFG